MQGIPSGRRSGVGLWEKGIIDQVDGIHYLSPPLRDSPINEVTAVRLVNLGTHV
jgi:hypothetical protein